MVVETLIDGGNVQLLVYLSTQQSNVVRKGALGVTCLDLQVFDSHVTRGWYVFTFSNVSGLSYAFRLTNS